MRVSSTKIIVRCFIAFVLLSVGGKSWGQLLQWNTFGNLGIETSEPSIFNSTNITSSNLTFGAGVTSAANGNRFGGNAWFDAGNTNPTTLPESITDNDYIEFIVTPSGGFSFTPTSFVFNWERSATGPSSLTLRSSADGFTANLGTLSGLSTSLTTGNTITISGLTNLSTATTFRLYGYAATNASGTGGFDVTSSVVNVQLNGTTCFLNPIVTNNLNSGVGSLRQAVLDACPGSTITFNMATVVSPISLSDGQIILDKNLIIQGPGANLLTVQNTAALNTTSRVFYMNSVITVTISGLTISGANCVFQGGGLYVGSSGIANVNSCTFSGNTAENGAGIFVTNGGTTNVNSCTFSGNTGTAQGGGIGLSFGGIANVTNSTISGNTGTAQGGGIFSVISTVNLVNSTITGNTGPLQGGGVYRNGGTVNTRNSIIAGNNSADGPDFFGAATSQGFNLIGKTNSSTGWIASDLQGTIAIPLNAMLDALANNGGPTMTHALQSTSSAIDKGAAADYPGTMTPIATDQRGSTRPVDDLSTANASGGNGSDIGAFEVQCLSGTWLGTSSNDWFVPANWSCGIVPTATTDVTIPAGTPNSPVIAGNTAQVHNITIQSSATLTNNSTLNLNGGGAIVNNGTYKGTGNFTGAVYNNNGGIVAPGLSPGCTGFGAGYTNGSGTEQIEIGGLTPCTLHDQLQVTGTATLSGILDVSLFSGYTPVCGESYTIMTSTTLSGTFTTINYPSLPAGLSWTIQYDFPNTGDVTLSVVGPPTAVATPPSQTVCSGLPITTIVINGSPLSGTLYNWTRDNGTLAGGTVTGIAAGAGNISGTLTNTTAAPVTVTFTITPVSGNCTGTAIFATVLVNPTTPVTITGAGTYCGGTTPTLTASSGFSSYSWTRFAFAGVLGTDQTLLVSKSGGYLVTATNSFGCSREAASVVQIGDFVFNGSISAASATMANRLLINNTISTCAAPKTCSVSGATGPFAYNLHTLVNPNPNPVCAIISANIMCIQFMNVSAYLGSFNPANICTNYLGDMGHALFGGTIPFEITIPGGATLVIKVGNTSSGSYCSNYVLVVDIPRVPPAITTTPDINICSVEQVTLTASQASSYLWSPGGATTQSITVSPTSFTNYIVMLGYGNNGCTANAQQSIFVSPTPTVAATPMTQTICSGNPITTIQVSSNPINATKEWTRDHTGDVTGIPASGNGSISGSLTNITGANVRVTFTITPGLNGCTGTAITATVDVSPTVTGVLSLASNNQLCAGMSGGIIVNLIGAPTFNGAFVIRNLTTNDVNLYIWSSSLLGGQQNITIPASFIPNTTGTPITYQFSWNSLTDANGCTGTLSGQANITVYPRPILVVVDPPPGNACTGNGVDFTVTELNNMPGTFDAVVRDGNNLIIGGGSNLPFGIYHFDVAGCSIPGPISFTFTPSASGPLGCGGQSITRSVTITDNIPPLLTGSLPGGNIGNSCPAVAPAAPTIAAIRSLYTDNCTAQAALNITGPVSNLILTGCSWTQTHTYTITDACNNSTEAVVTFTGTDTQGPSWTTAIGSLHTTINYCDITALNNAQALMPAATDNCLAAGEIVINKTAGSFVAGPCETAGTITNTFMATDGCNNSIVFTQVITVVDNTAPIISTINQNTLVATCGMTLPNFISMLGISAVDCNPAGSMFPNPAPIIYDNNTIGNNRIWQNPAPGSPISAAPGSIFQVLITAADGCGNSILYFINVLAGNLAGSIAGTITSPQNAATNSVITFTGSGSGAPAGTQQYRFFYSLSTNGGAFSPQGFITGNIGSNTATLNHSNAAAGTFVYRLDQVVDLAGSCSSPDNLNLTATVIVTAGVINLSLVYDMSSSQVGPGGTIEEVLVVKNIGQIPTDGSTITVNISTYLAFSGLTVSFLPAGAININGTNYTPSPGWSFNPLTGDLTSNNVIPGGSNNIIRIRITRGSSPNQGAPGTLNQTGTIMQPSGGELPAQINNNSINTNITKS